MYFDHFMFYCLSCVTYAVVMIVLCKLQIFYSQTKKKIECMVQDLLRPYYKSIFNLISNKTFFIVAK